MKTRFILSEETAQFPSFRTETANRLICYSWIFNFYVVDVQNELNYQTDFYPSSIDKY